MNSQYFKTYFMIRDDITELYDFLEEIGVTRSMLQTKDLLGKISEDQLSFEIEVEEFFEAKTLLQARLHFRKHRTTAYYLFKYDAHLNYVEQSDRNVKQTFLMLQMRPTLKEAFNLLQGRCVLKSIRSTQGEEYNCWVRLEFTEVDASNDFKIIRYRHNPFTFEKFLDQYPTLMEASDEMGRSKLLKSLKTGNKELVTFRKENGKPMKKVVEMNPQLKRLKINDPPKHLAD
jgi:hypothetical protein